MTTDRAPARSTSRPVNAGTARPASAPIEITGPATFSGSPTSLVRYTSVSGRNKPDPKLSTPSAVSSALWFRCAEWAIWFRCAVRGEVKRLGGAQALNFIRKSWHLPGGPGRPYGGNDLGLLHRVTESVAPVTPGADGFRGAAERGP